MRQVQPPVLSGGSYLVPLALMMSVTLVLMISQFYILQRSLVWHSLCCYSMIDLLICIDGKMADIDIDEEMSDINVSNMFIISVEFLLWVYLLLIMFDDSCLLIINIDNVGR